jgi:hypothetical protein
MKANDKDFDPDVVVPAAVKAAAARADAVFNATYKKDATAAEPVAVEAPAAPLAPAPAAAEAPPATPMATPEVTPPKPDDVTFEHKYNSMKGRHDRLVAQVQAMSGTIANLERVIATMQPATPVPATPELAPERLITTEEEADYGADLLKVVGKKAKDELNPELNALKSKITDLEGRISNVGGYVAKSARESMESSLDEQCPTWREVNFMPEFKEWLQLPDLYSGAIRHSLLKAAYEQNNTPRTLAFFKGFLAEEAATAPAGQQPDLSAAPPAPAKVSLESLAAPGRAKTAAATTPTEKPTFTRPDIAKFYVDVRAGKYRGKEAEKDAFERQIFAAQAEGRIR